MKQERYYVNGYQPPVGVDNRNTVREYQRSLNVTVETRQEKWLNFQAKMNSANFIMIY